MSPTNRQKRAPKFLIARKCRRLDSENGRDKEIENVWVGPADHDRPRSTQERVARLSLFGVFRAGVSKQKRANLDKRHDLEPSSHPSDLILFRLGRNLKPSAMQICPLMLIFGLSFSPFVNGDQRGKRQIDKGDVRPGPRRTDGMFSAQNMSTPVIKCAPPKRKDGHGSQECSLKYLFCSDPQIEFKPF